MIKRILSLLLALVMVVGLLPGNLIRAAETSDQIYIDESASLDELVESCVVDLDIPEDDIPEEEPDIPMTPQVPTQEVVEVPADNSELSEPAGELPDLNIDEADPSPEPTQPSNVRVVADSEAVVEEEATVASGTLSGSEMHAMTTSDANITGDTVWQASETGDIGVSGATQYIKSDLSIRIIPDENAPLDATQLHINLFQLNINGNYEVRVYLDETAFQDYTNLTEVIIHGTGAHTIYVTGGASFTLEGLENCRLVLSGADKDGVAKVTERRLLYLLEVATVNINYVTFRHAPIGAVRGRGGQMSSVTFSNCKFESTCSNKYLKNYSAGNGGAIDFDATTASVETTVASLTVSNCEFDGNTATGNGGAMNLASDIDTLTISNSTFKNCSAGAYGGAIYVANSTNVSISGGEISGNTATGGSGGGVAISGVSGTSVSITDAEVYGNTAGADDTDLEHRGSGGGIYLNGTGMKATISGGSFGVAADAADPVKAGNKAITKWIEKTDADGNVVTDENGNPEYEAYGGVGGGLAAYGVKVTMTDTKVLYNESTFTGGGIGLRNGATISITNADVQYNRSSSGGGISVSEGHGNTAAETVAEQNALYISGGTISNNRVVEHEHVTSSGGAIFVSDSTGISITGAEISDNTSDIYGGAIYAVDCTGVSISFADGELSGNTAGSFGGAIYMSNSTGIDISGGQITGNTAGGYGGGIWIKDSTGTDISISETQVSGNTATGGYGGGVAISGIFGTSVSITSTEVYGNTAGADDADPEHRGSGGGIYLNGEGMEATISGCAIGVAPDSTDPTKVGNKAIAKWTEKTDVDGNVVMDESGNPDYEVHGGVGGGLAVNGVHVTMTGTSVIYNETTYAGGGISLRDGATMSITNADVQYNRSSSGGGISIHDCHGDPAAEDVSGRYGLYINGGSISNNRVFEQENVEAAGGGILQLDAKVRLDGVSITYNTAANVGEDGENVYEGSCYGGGLAAYSKSTMEVFGGVIQYNTARIGGGLALYSGSNATLNPGTAEGAAGVQLSNNTAYGYGAGAYVMRADEEGNVNSLTVNNGTVTNNTAYESSGGGIAVHTGGTLNIRQSEVSGNRCFPGYVQAVDENNAPLYDAEGNPVYVPAKDVDENPEYVEGGPVVYKESGGYGGGIYCFASTANVIGCDIHDNTAGRRGGGMYSEDGSMIKVTNITDEDGEVLVRSKIRNNIARDYAGGVGAVGEVETETGSAITLEGTLIEYNSTLNNGGGGVYISSLAVCTMDEHTMVQNNTANTYGGGIYANILAVIQVNGATLTQNKANRSGGGIYVNAGSDVTVTGGTISDNEAAENGGGIVAGGTALYGCSTVTVTGGQIMANVAGHDGGGIYAGGALKEGEQYSSNVLISGGEITQNTAGNYGGGVCVTVRSNVTITNGDISNNVATVWGGGVMGNSRATVNLEGGTISGNNAAAGGGVGVASSAKIYVKNGTISSNNAQAVKKVDAEGKESSSYGYGGGIYATNTSSIEITGGEITGNKALSVEYTKDSETGETARSGGNGGGIYTAYSAEVIIGSPETADNGEATSDEATQSSSAGKITLNEADLNGGGIYATGLELVTKDEAGNITGYIYHQSKVTVYGGEISNNKALGAEYTNDKGVTKTSGGTGGGIYATGVNPENPNVTTENASAIVTVYGGQIHKNTANSNGGGIYATVKASVTITGGQIINNTTEQKNGAGLYATSSSTVNLNGGEITENTADQGDGAGLYVTGSATVNLNGGKIRGNTVTDGNGGGVYTAETATVTLNGGEIFENTATGTVGTRGLGGGIFSGGTSTVVIASGKVYKNQARAGGGVYAAGSTGATVTVSGGQISENTANAGAGLYATGNTVVTVQGGEVSNNTAKGSGGGIYVGTTENNSPTVNIMKDTENNTVGKIQENTARNGGGIYVGYNGMLTVNGGHIINNQAIVPSSVKEENLPETGYQQTTLYGAGGGICVVGDATRSATFILAEGDMAIYGNLADYSGDDVFSNGLNTSLTVPLVSEMNLSGYEFDAIGWFEDYNTDDTSYAVGLNMISVHNAENKDVKRYRSSLVTERQIIDESFVKGTGNAAAAEYVNKVNAYVAMTLGIPAAIHDTVVIDYDLSVNIDLLKNDMIGLTDDIENEDKTLGMAMPAGILETNDIFYTMSTTVAEGFMHDLTEAADSCIELAFGKANWTTDGLLNYIVTDMNMDEDEVFWYAVTDSKCSYYAKVTIVPATTIYYEDNCGFITYGSSTETSAWTEVGTAINDKTQGQDRPGASMREDLDADNIYGYDGSYSETATYSMGSAMKTTVSTGNNATADFTFTGTGFDIISRSDSNTGLITVTIYQGSPAEGQTVTELVQVETLMVDAWYESEGSLYQVPLIKKSGLAYGTYTVRIRAAYGSWADHGQNGGNKSWDFYLDAIRIYDPAGNGGNNQEIQDAYLQDNECWPSYQELRNMFLTQNDLTKDPMSGTIFIDGDDTPSVSQYKNYGPNNEVYLAKGQSIGFTLNALNYTGSYTSTAFTQELVAAIHIGMRGLTGMGNVTVRAADGTVLTTDLSTTDMYYDITDMMNQVVTIINTGETPIAVSTVKVTHTQQPTATASLTALFTVDTYTAETALTMVAAVNDTAETPILTPKYPSLSFEGMICYNVFFDAQNLGDLTGADLGLAVFGSEDTEGTVETAMDVITGADMKDGLYVISTNGIPAKNMADVLYFKVFVKLADGSYVYSNMVSYSAVQYAKNTLANSDDRNLKALVVAMLNYGAQAQQLFGYNTEDLMNKDLTAAEQELLSSITADSLNSVGKADAAKVGAFASNGGFTMKYPTISFEGAFEINYYFLPEHTVNGGLTLYFWNEDTYNAATELTADNADNAVAMTLENGIYTAVSDPIAAQYLDKTVYVAAVYESEGVTYCSGVLPYSIAAYCQIPPADMQELANAATIYGCIAKAFFNA